jgi:threonine/homoserine/homoserine lactone efflux protein
MARKFWIVFYSFALVIFVGILISIPVLMVVHHDHQWGRVLFMTTGFAILAWITLRLLRREIREPSSQPATRAPEGSPR